MMMTLNILPFTVPLLLRKQKALSEDEQMMEILASHSRILRRATTMNTYYGLISLANPVVEPKFTSKSQIQMANFFTN